MDLDVECYAGGKPDDRPARFRLHGHQYEVEEVVDQWAAPDSISYKIRAGDGNFYILRRRTSTPEGTWDLVSFRQSHE